LRAKRVVLLIASDDRLFRECLGHRFGEETGFEVRGFADAGSVLARAREVNPGVLLLDMDSLGTLPESLLQRIRSARPDIAILAMATIDTEHAVARLLRAGVSGFVAKRESVQMLLRAVSAVASGETWAPRRATARALSGLAEDQRDAAVRLTPRESELLSLLPGGYRNKELARMLGIKEQTVKMHLYRLFQKLHVKSRMAAVLAAGARHEPSGNARGGG
jgi:DNA-binding NarL/FixJ family response regulator